jgi:hypothetical protein
MMATVFLCMCAGSVFSVTSFFKASLPGYNRKKPNIIIAMPNFIENLENRILNYSLMTLKTFWPLLLSAFR